MTNFNYQYYGIGMRGYAPINDELVYVTIKSTKLFLKEQNHVVYTLTLPNGSDVECGSELAMYESKEDFEVGIQKKKVATDLKSILESRVSVAVDGNGVYVFVWTFEHNDAVKRTVEPSTITFTMGAGGKLDDPILSGVYYESREKAFEMNDYVVKEADGSTHVVRSVIKAMQLDDEQKEVLAEFMRARKKLSEHKINIMYDNDDETMYAYNAKNVHIEGRDEHDFKGMPAEEKAGKKLILGRYDLDSMFENVGLLYDNYLGYDNGIAVKVKNND